MENNNTKIKVYFDGLCHLCSREINHYRKMNGAQNIEFIDITASNFNAVNEEVDLVEVHKNMHVKDRNGNLHFGVDAFVCIWKELPSLRFLVPIAETKPIGALLKVLYAGFAKIRPLLPRKACEDSPYCEVHVKS